MKLSPVLVTLVVAAGLNNIFGLPLSLILALIFKDKYFSDNIVALENFLSWAGYLGCLAIVMIFGAKYRDNEPMKWIGMGATISIIALIQFAGNGMRGLAMAVALMLLLLIIQSIIWIYDAFHKNKPSGRA